MKKLLIAIVVILVCQTKMNAQCTVDTISNDIIMLVDNSASINNAEFGSFGNMILSSINSIASNCPLSRRGVVHYGGAFGQSVNIEHQLSSTDVINSINRQYCLNAVCNDGGDDLNYAMGEIIRMINNNELQLDPDNRLSIVVFTDAFSDAFCASPNCSVTLPTTNVDILKSTYGANVSVIGMSSDARPEFLAITASPGGTYSGTTLNNACNTSLDGCSLPRQYIPVEFTDNPLTVGAQVAALVSCQANIISTANVDAGSDQIICSDRGESASLMAASTSGQAPFTYSWSNNLGTGPSVVATPTVTTTFTVTITDDNGCEGTDQVRVEVQTCGPNCADDTIFNDVVFMVDNSLSIDNSEFASFENIILTSLAGVRAQCPTSRRALVHYGGAFGRDVSIEYALGSIAEIPSINRQFCLNANCNDGGDDLNFAMGELINLINDGSLGRNSANKLNIVLFTDAFNDNSCDTNPNCSTSLPTTNVDILKDAFGATVTVIGISDQATPSTLALTASPGGSFVNVTLNNSCSTTFDGCTLPRKYIPVEFNTPPQQISDSLQTCLVCQAIIQAKVIIDAGPDQTFCENLGETASINLVALNGQEPITYQWDNNQGTNSSIIVRPLVPTTYRVTATDANDCTAIDSVLISPIQCNDCFAEAGVPLAHKEICLENNRATITTEDNIGVNIPQGYEKVYILTDRDLTIIDYAINNGSFSVAEPGLYRVHTLVAEVNSRNDEDYFDINVIIRGSSNLFIIANCIIDHNICADFDFPGRVHIVLPPGDMMCMTFENTINLCNDGIDNDSDGLVDCMDDDCKALIPCLENTLIACNDLFDNDGDGLVDCFDSDCWEFIRCFEREEDCNDGIDNDGDGLIDCEDDSCFGSSECMEDSPYTCKDGLDNDRDGLVDCQEESCREFLVCAEWGEAACSDGIDNDSDGLVDCADAECRLSFPSTCGAIEASAAFCGDGIDNDADGLVDCADPDCGVTMLTLETITSAITNTNSTCPNNNNGSLTIDLDQTGWEYSINGGESFSTNTTYDNLIQGDYEVILRRASGCAVVGPTITISGEQCPEICENGIDDDGDGAIDCEDSDCGLLEALPAIATDPVCPQADNGSIRLFFLSGGNTAGIEYSIDGVVWQDSPIFRNLIGGTYNVDLRTSNGCTARKTYILTTPDCPEICNNGLDDDKDGAIDCEDSDCGIILSESDISISNLTCPSENDGTVSITHSQTGLQYKIDSSAFQDAPLFENLTAGSYLLTVVNGSGCQATLSFTVVAVDCSEICDNGIDDDGNGFTDCEDISCQDGLASMITVVNSTCPKNINGSISIDSAKVGSVYSINNSPTQSAPSFENLIPGTYSLTILNADGCSMTTSVVLEGSSCTETCDNGIDDDGNGLIDCEDGACTTGLNAIATSTSTTCPDNNNGTIRIEDQQGAMSYSLNGETFQEEGLFENLEPGNYVMTIRNPLGCSSVQSVVVEGENCTEVCDNGIDDDGNGLVDCEDGACQLGLEVDLEVIQASCPDNNNGSIRILAAATGSEFSIDGQTFQAEDVFENLLPGDYTLTVQNAEGCLNTMVATIIESTCTEICDNGIDDDGNGLIDCEDPSCGVLTFDGAILVTDDDCDPENHGFIEISGQIDGVNYSYSIDGGDNFESFREFEGLAQGTYTVVIMTNGSCSYSQEVLISKPVCAEVCNNGIDDDGNGLVDCEDGACNVGLEVQLEITEATCPNNDNGKIQIFGLAAGSELSLNGQSYQTTTVYEDLIPGEYSLAIRNTEGCLKTIMVTIAESSCSEICDNIDLSSGLIAYYPFNGNANDKSGKEHTGNVIGCTLTEDRFGNINSAYDFDGVNDYIDIAHDSSLNLSAFTFSSWVYDDVDRDYQIICMKGRYGINVGAMLDNREFTIDANFENTIHIGIRKTNNTWHILDYPELSLLTWKHILVTFDGSKVQLFTNGELTAESISSTPMFDPISPESLTIGASFETENGNVVKGYYRDGKMDDIRIYNRALCSDEVTALFNEDDVCSSDLTLEFNATNATCPDNNNGSIQIITADTTSQYSIDGENFQSEKLFENLLPGDYTLTQQNSNGCSNTVVLTINESACSVTEICDNGIDDDGNGLIDCEDGSCNSFSNFIVAANPPSCTEDIDGRILIIDGLEGYQYSLSGSAFQLSTSFEGLAIGEYLLTIRNAEGCDTTITTTLTTDVTCANMGEGVIVALQMDINVILEGPYDPNTGMMNTLLNDQGYLPGQLPITYFGKSTPAGHPYSEAPWHYDGSEGAQMIDNIDRLQSAYAESIVDWVLVSLRTNLSPESEVFQGAGLLHFDGTIEMQRLAEVPEDDTEYYIVIEHRNHLPVMSPTPIPIVQGEIMYDFSARDSYRSIIGTGQLNLDGTYVMVAGNGEMVLDYSSDTDINVKDLTAWLFNNGENSSYYLEDYDLNGDINIKDRILWEKNNGSFSPLKTK